MRHTWECKYCVSSRRSAARRRYSGGTWTLNSKSLPGARKPDRGRTPDARPRASGDGEQAGGSDATEALEGQDLRLERYRGTRPHEVPSLVPKSFVTASGGSPSNPQLCWGLLAMSRRVLHFPLRRAAESIPPRCLV